jgi:F-type H+-transporting ATPase subunit b
MLFASAGAASSGGGNFLIPNGTFIVELVIFLVVLGIIAKWILPPLQEVGETRRARIRTSLQEAEQARAEAQSLTAERDRLLAEARVQARGILDHANQGADAALEQGRVRGQEEYERLVQASRHEIDVESRSARDELVRRLDSLVLAASERVLGSEIDAALHLDVIKDAVAAAIGAASDAGAV